MGVGATTGITETETSSGRTYTVVTIIVNTSVVPAGQPDATSQQSKTITIRSLRTARDHAGWSLLSSQRSPWFPEPTDWIEEKWLPNKRDSNEGAQNKSGTQGFSFWTHRLPGITLAIMAMASTLVASASEIRSERSEVGRAADVQPGLKLCRVKLLTGGFNLNTNVLYHGVECDHDSRALDLNNLIPL